MCPCAGSGAEIRDTRHATQTQIRARIVLESINGPLSLQFSLREKETRKRQQLPNLRSQLLRAPTPHSASPCTNHQSGEIHHPGDGHLDFRPQPGSACPDGPRQGRMGQWALRPHCCHCKSPPLGRVQGGVTYYPGQERLSQGEMPVKSRETAEPTDTPRHTQEATRGHLLKRDCFMRRAGRDLRAHPCCPAYRWKHRAVEEPDQDHSSRKERAKIGT